MTAHTVRHDERRLSPARRASRTGLLVLGWGQFWLLTGLLGALLALFLVILLAHLSSL